MEAIYQGGVFLPTSPVNLPENRRVRLRVETIEVDDPQGRVRDVQQWIEGIRGLQKRIIDRNSILPDSTPEIAED